MHGVLPLRGGSRAATAAVEALLRDRADRGVFRAFASARLRGKLDCSLVWLQEQPFRVVFDPRRGILVFRDLLPNMDRSTQIYEDFRDFLAGRADEGLPAHRRIDPERVRVRALNRKATVSLSLESLDGDWEYAVAKSLKLVNEVFLGFLRGPYFEYMAENFGEPED